MKTVFIESGGMTYHWLGDPYELPPGRHEITAVMPKVGGDASESDWTKAHRVAQMLQGAYPQRVKLVVEYDEASKPPDPVVEAVAEKAPAEASPTAEETKPAPKWKHVPKTAADRRKRGK